MEDIFEELAEVDEIEDDRGGGDDEAIEVPSGDAKRIVKPAKKRVMRLQPKLDAMRLNGSRGIEVLEKTFENIKYKGKGHELEDLTSVLLRLQHWAHRLYPKANFQDCIDKIEELGSKKAVSVTMTKLRLGMLDSVITHISDIEETHDTQDQVVQDPFDYIIEPQKTQQPAITDEQKERMMRNRLIAEERRKARIQALKEQDMNDLTPELIENSNKISTSDQEIVSKLFNEFMPNLPAPPSADKEKAKENFMPIEQYEPVAGPSWLSDWQDFQPSPPHS